MKQQPDAWPYYDEVQQRIHDLVAKARLVERLLPGECAQCEGAGIEAFIGASTVETGESVFYPCARCSGSGQVWDEGIVESVAKANFVYFNNDKGYGAETWKRLPSAVSAPYLEQGRAVLSALVGLLTEKVKT